jgi:anti-anti-sigma factor
MTIRLHLPLDEEAAGEGVTVIRFTGGTVSLNEETTDRIRDQLLSVAGEPGPPCLLLDFGNVDYVSSLGLGLLIALHKQLRSAGRRLSIGNLSEQVQEVFVVTRLDRLLDLRQRVAPARQEERWIEVPRG